MNLNYNVSMNCVTFKKIKRQVTLIIRNGAK